MDEFLDLPPEPPPMVDLHLGAATVVPFSKNKLRALGPKPIGPGVMMLNVLIVVAALANLVLFFNVWKWLLVD